MYLPLTDIIHSRTDINSIKIGSGATNRFELEKHAVERIVAHPLHRWVTLDYDAGVVKLVSPIVESDVRKPVALVKTGEHPTGAEPLIVSGWGCTMVSTLLPESSVVKRAFKHLYIPG